MPDVLYLPPLHQKLAVLVLAVLGALWLVRMMRRHRLREEHALLWLLGLVAGVVVIWCEPLLIAVTRLLGVKVPASALMLTAIFFLLEVTAWLTTLVSVQKRQITDLIISVSILQARVEERESGRSQPSRDVESPS